MPSFKYNANNTEGAYPTSIDFIDTEIKKGDKIVATDLVDLYDTYPENETPNQGDALVYDDVDGIWKPGEGAGSSCNIFIGYDERNRGYTEHSVFVKQNDTSNGDGTYRDPFLYLEDCLEFLNNCKVIPDEITLTIELLSDVTLTDYISLNHLQGHNISINGNGNRIINKSYMSDFIYISCGGNHSIALKSDGTIWGVGDNSVGQIGLDDITDINTFTKIGTDNNWTYVSCGDYYSMAIKSNGTLWGTGSNLRGQLGLSDNTDRTIFTQVGTDGDWIQVDCGSNHSMAIKSNGTLWGTGDNRSGSLSLGDTTNRNFFTQEIGLETDWAYVNCSGEFFSMAIKSNGTLWGTGRNLRGQLGLGDETDRTVFTQVGIDINWNKVFCGTRHTLAIKSNGTLWATGYNYYGQLGLGNNTNRNTFTQVGTDYDWIHVICGGDNSMTIKSDGTLWVVGDNQGGQLGLGDNTNRNFFTQVGINTDYILIVSGKNHSMTIKSDGTILSTGYNYYGQLGLGDNTDRNIFIVSVKSTYYSKLLLTDNHSLKEIKNVIFDNYLIYQNDSFVIIEDKGNIVHVTGHQSFSMILKSDGTLWGTGNNYYGCLGLGDETRRYVFTQEIGTDNDWKVIGCGAGHTMTIKLDGTLWATGRNISGQLGLGDYNDRNIFTKVGNDNDWKYIICGESHSMAIKSDGTLWGAGRNYEGQLGLGQTDNYYNTFIQIGTDTDWVQVACGDYYSMAIKSDGTLWGTGNNDQGQLGLGDNTDRNIFTKIGIDTDWVQFDCKSQTSVAIKSNGTLWSTGNNYWGQLGLGDEGPTTYRNIFTQEIGLDNDWKEISCGAIHTIAIKTDGTVWGTGSNDQGEMGWGQLPTKVNIYTNHNISYDFDIFICGYWVSYVIKSYGSKGTLWVFGNNKYGALGLGEYELDFIYDTTYSDGGITINGISSNNFNVFYYSVDIKHTDIKNNSSLSMSNVFFDQDTKIMTKELVEGKLYSITYLNNYSINCENKSIINSKCNELNQVSIDNSFMNVDLSITEQMEWQIKNNSTLIISQEPSVYPTVNNYESTYIINGVLQP